MNQDDAPETFSTTEIMWHSYRVRNVTLKAIILKGFRSSVYISTNSFLMMQLKILSRARADQQ